MHYRGHMLQAILKARLTRPHRGLKAEIRSQHSDASAMRFGVRVTERMVRSCWAEFLDVKRRHLHRFDALIDWQSSPVPVLFSLPDNQPRAWQGAR